MSEKKEYLLLKRGVYYAPDNCGYTGLKRHAGRYSQKDAYPEEGIVAVHENDAPECSPECYSDFRAIEAERISVLKSVREVAIGSKSFEVIAHIDQLLNAAVPYAKPLK